MRAVTSNAVNAFYMGATKSFGNTKVITNENESKMYLFGNLIAKLQHETNTLKISNAGWNSRTTYDRLNGLKGVRINTKKGITYLNDKEWDGEWTEVI